MVLHWMDRKRHEAIMQISLEQIFNFYLFTVVSSNLLPYREKSLYLETFRYATRGRDQHFSKQFSMEGGRDNLLVAKFQKIKLRSVHHVEKFSFSMRRLVITMNRCTRRKKRKNLVSSPGKESFWTGSK